MGSSNSKARSFRKSTTSTGFMGRERHAQNYQLRIPVSEINAREIGRAILRFCGNEGQHPYLDEVGYTTLRFLRAANSFIPDAEDDGANMKNCAFILRLPGREFVIIAGSGDFEYDFCEEADGVIYGRCIRQSTFRYCWDGFKSVFVRLFTAASSFITGMLPSFGPRNALEWE